MTKQANNETVTLHMGQNIQIQEQKQKSYDSLQTGQETRNLSQSPQKDILNYSQQGIRYIQASKEKHLQNQFCKGRERSRRIHSNQPMQSSDFNVN